ncbi:hypothetical protein I7I50_00065 [Histoplasma capsulatum G186AR]|nr:hypothetical protein I7I52_07334 [Histoplasma capsulatum]QSS72267.1 hypothetical protein I7I50_00065 [Histoplasma capsulatum G186AR]
MPPTPPAYMALRPELNASLAPRPHLAQLKWDHGVANDSLNPSLLKCHWAEHASSGPTRRHDPLDNERLFRQSTDLIPRQYFSGKRSVQRSEVN